MCLWLPVESGGQGWFQAKMLVELVEFVRVPGSVPALMGGVLGNESAVALVAVYNAPQQLIENL